MEIHVHHHHHGSPQRSFSVWVTVFNGILTIVWLLSMIAMGLHFLLPHSTILDRYFEVCQTVAFVTFISLYCNFVSQLAAFIAGLAAIFSSAREH